MVQAQSDFEIGNVVFGASQPFILSYLLNVLASILRVAGIGHPGRLAIPASEALGRASEARHTCSTCCNYSVIVTELWVPVVCDAYRSR
jgi:hypothetical protein